MNGIWVIHKMKNSNSIQFKFKNSITFKDLQQFTGNLFSVDLAIAFAAICKNKVGHQKYDR